MSANTLPDFLPIPGVLVRGKRPLDGYVFGVVYWYSKLRLQKCTLSNKGIADLLDASAGSVANSLSRLHKAGIVSIVLDPETNQRTEIIPLITFTRQMKGVNPQIKGPSSTDEQNKKSKEDKEKIYKKERKANTSYPKAYLTNIPEDDLRTFQEKYNVRRQDVLGTAEKILNWCDSKGKAYKNYRAALMNWLDNSFGRRAASEYMTVHEVKKLREAAHAIRA